MSTSIWLDPSSPQEPGGSQAQGDGPSPSSQVCDKEQFTEFYKNAMPRLVASLRWSGVPVADAVECAQEALTVCYREWSSIKHNHYAWCKTTAYRAYLKGLRRYERPVDDVEAVRGALLLQSSTEIAAFETKLVEISLIERLPPKQRAVFAWILDGGSIADIAGLLGISKDAARNNLCLARKKLDRMMSEGEVK